MKLKNKNRKISLIIGMVLISFFSLFLLEVIGEEHTLQIKLRINNTSNYVYIPGIGEEPASELGNETYTSPTHYYLASYLNNLLIGLVGATGNKLTVSNTSTTHSIEIDQDLTKSRVFLTFTRGDWKTVDKRINLIEMGQFLTQIAPSFAFGLGNYYPIKIVLSYTNIDIKGKAIKHKGTYEVLVECNESIAGKPVVILKIT